MSGTIAGRPVFDRSEEDLGNIVELGHVNTTVPDQRLATLFYVTGLGGTRDPYLMTGIENMWINFGRSQFHLPSRPAAQVLRGTTGLVLPDLDALARRLRGVQPLLAGTAFGFQETDDGIEATCPWGNRIRCHAPNGARFGAMVLGMPYVEFGVRAGALDAIARFYREILGALAGTGADARGQLAWAVAGDGSRLVFRETDAPAPAYDGHHIQISLVDFSGPHRRLLERELVTEESDQHQYRFQDIVDPASNEVLFTIEHEVRSMRHPMYARPLVNRVANITNRNYMPGHEAASWAMAPG